jgi:nucleoside-diphosphate-sugar epimerase
MNLFITGSNGFVGSRLMYFLEEKGHQVRGIDNNTQCNIQPHPNTVIGDIRNIEDLRKFNDKNFDLIIHCAASKHDFGISKESYFSNNEYGTKMLMNYATERNINKVIYYSTVSVYGHQSEPCDEEAELLSNTVYGDSKLSGEKVICKWQNENTSREVIVLRPSVIYGPHNFANMYNLINQMHKFPWFMIGTGNYIKSMVALENMVDIINFILNHMKPGVQNFNCIDKPYLSVRELMELIALNKGFKMPKFIIPLQVAVCIGKIFDIIGKILQKDLPVNSDRMKKIGTSTDYRAEKIRELGYIQKYTIKDEIKRTCKWYILVSHR